MIRRLLDPLFQAQAAWADPLGDLMQRVVKAVYGPFPPLRDFLHGTWLGHPLHPAITDLPIGAFVVGLALDLVGLSAAATWATGIGLVAMLAAALTGYADYADLGGTAKRYGTIHSALMLVAAVLYALSLALRLEWLPALFAADEVWTAGVGLVLVLVAAYAGGELVFDLGSQVDRHAWRTTGTKWLELDLSEIPEDKPTKAKAGAQTLVVVRRADRIFGLHDTCAHQGCSLSAGRLVDGGARIECECHGSRFALADGSVSRGPAVYPQPRYEVRRRADGKLEARRAG